jgi:transcriptional regulator with XRE-family HTH domain
LSVYSLPVMGREDEESTVFGRRLRQRREEVGVSVSELAKKIGVSEGAIRQMEGGQTKNAVLPNGLQIAVALRCSPWWLAGLPDPADRPDVAITASAGSGKTQALVVAQIVEAVISRLTDPEDDASGALEDRLEPFVQQVVQASARDLKRRIQATDRSLLAVIERLTLVEQELSERAPRRPKTSNR